MITVQMNRSVVTIINGNYSALIVLARVYQTSPPPALRAPPSPNERGGNIVIIYGQHNRCFRKPRLYVKQEVGSRGYKGVFVINAVGGKQD